MTKTITIKREIEDEKIKVFFGKIDGEWQAKTEPYNMVIEDSVLDMILDIGMWDFNYLKEVVADNNTNVAASF